MAAWNAGHGDEIQFKAYEPPQGQLLAGFVADALDPSDPLYFVDDVVEGLDLRGVRTTLRRPGRARVPAADAAEALAVRGDR